MKVFSTGVLVGRFQHIHTGHEKLINIGLSLCEKLLIFVGSADKINTSRNPFEVEYRIKLISKIYEEEIKKGSLIIKPINDLTNENDLTPNWGKYVIEEANNILGAKVNCIIYGKDKNIFKCFSKSLVKNLTEIYVDRNTLNISATKIRQYLKQDDKENWKKYVNPKIYSEYSILREKLLNVKEE